MDITKAIRLFQEFFGLEVTGTLNNETFTLMKKPPLWQPGYKSENRDDTNDIPCWEKTRGERRNLRTTYRKGTIGILTLRGDF